MANKALLVGINTYPSAPLRGCINDSKNVCSMLMDRYGAINDVNKWVTNLTSFQGFEQDNIRMLLDSRATTEAIEERLWWLIHGAKPGDRLVFHYSGHGSQLPIRDYEEGKVTQLHDCICPVDFDFTPEHAITDDGFRNVFKYVPEGVVFDWISDSCHSGDLARSINSDSNYMRPRQFPMPADIAWQVSTAESKGITPLSFERVIQHLHGAFISGCRSDQTSADTSIGGEYCGAATYFFLQSLDCNGAGYTKPRTQIVEEMAAELNSRGYSQVPQLRGSPGHLAKPWLQGD